MTTPPARTPRRTDALSRDRIVFASIAILDAGGADALTVRALGIHLSTGRGAIYHHVSSMDDLLAAAADHVIGQALTPADPPVAHDADPHTALRALALSIFDAIDRHPWLGAQLSREPLQPAVFSIWSATGQHLDTLGVTGASAATAGSALVNYILGATTQYAAGPRSARDATSRQAKLDRVAAAWADHDPTALVGDAALHLREHDDRAQFLAGIDLFLLGIEHSR